jgi:hypothetical protein
MKSNYGNRDTVGTTYLNAQKDSSDGYLLQDFTSEMVHGLVDDINETIRSDPFKGNSFYISVVEERDLQMKNAIKRRLFVTQYQPYPEDNTLVFFVDVKLNEVSFCWDLPHHSELPNILSNEYLYDHGYVARIKEWLKNDLSNFGFVKVSMGSPHVEGYDEKMIVAYKQAYENYCRTLQMDEKSIENEMKFGFFWIPNKFAKFQKIEQQKRFIFESI